jgi:hypothetical protein
MERKAGISKLKCFPQEWILIVHYEREAVSIGWTGYQRIQGLTHVHGSFHRTASQQGEISVVKTWVSFSEEVIQMGVEERKCMGKIYCDRVDTGRG